MKKIPASETANSPKSDTAWRVSDNVKDANDDLSSDDKDTLNTTESTGNSSPTRNHSEVNTSTFAQSRPYQQQPGWPVCLSPSYIRHDLYRPQINFAVPTGMTLHPTIPALNPQVMQSIPCKSMINIVR